MLPPRPSYKRAFSLIALTVAIVISSLSLSGSQALTALEIVRAAGVLRVVTVSGLTTYFEDANGGNGFEYLLAKAFADSLGVRIEIRLKDSLGATYGALDRDDADFAAAGLIANAGQRKSVRYSTSYDNVVQKLIRPIKSRRVHSFADIADGDLIAVAEDQQSARLVEARRANSRPGWQTLWGLDSTDLFEKIRGGEVPYAVVDSSAYAANHNFYPEIRVAFDITEAEPVSWAFPAATDDSLLRSADAFLSKYAISGQLQSLKDSFFYRGKELRINFSQPFLKDLATSLEKYRTLFVSISQEYNIDWHLLAAIAYQESRWDPLATSMTGVRGLMMLTEGTAREMGIRDRLDAEQSLRGGARYFTELKARIPADITEPDRTWLALAAYNIGLAHLEDARVLTQRHGKNPDLWRDVNQHLPLLQRKEYHSTLKYGFARGSETAGFVRRVQRYKTILNWYGREQELLAAKKRAYLPSSSDMVDAQESL